MKATIFAGLEHFKAVTGEMMSRDVSAAATVESVRLLLRTAESLLQEDYIHLYHADDEPSNDARIELLIENSFLQLLTFTEISNLHYLHSLVLASYEEAKNSSKGLAASDQYQNLDRWLKWSIPIEQFCDAIAGVFGLRTAHARVQIDLLTVLRSCQRAITDPACYPTTPTREADVHARIEMILRCVYPDLKHLPALTKPIKNFAPDTGLPSIRTLVEYKYMERAADAGPIADQILADTRGYEASEWQSIVFVIYETQRFKELQEWKMLLKECQVPEEIEIVLLHGEPPNPKEQEGRAKRGRPRNVAPATMTEQEREKISAAPPVSPEPKGDPQQARTADS